MSLRASLLRLRVCGRRLGALLLICAPLSANSGVLPMADSEPAPRSQTCPDTVPGGSRCWSGTDTAGAPYLIVVPEAWNRTLLLHAHGGPYLVPVTIDRPLEDLKRWNVWVRAGYAFAASAFRQPGVAVRAAAEDTERLRQIFFRHIAVPDRTLLHGQSWGANVAAKGAELFVIGRPYDGLLLSSGLLAGGSRAYEFRLDLRVVYQYLCRNHPRPHEPDYPLWMGLPAGASMTQQQLAGRARECLGLGLPVAQRSAEQRKRLATLSRVVRIPEEATLSHLSFATFHFQDIVHKRTGGGNPFGNIGARYQGSDDDTALNATVARYRADPAALARLAADTDLSGRIQVPVLTVHAVDDPRVFVEVHSAFARTMAEAGSDEYLMQVYTGHNTHSYLADPVYIAAADLLNQWIDSRQKPTTTAFAQRCREAESRWGTGCRSLPEYRPAPLESRVTPRERP